MYSNDEHEPVAFGRASTATAAFTVVSDRPPRECARPLHGPSGIVLDLDAHFGWIEGGEDIALSRREFLLLRALLERWGEPVRVDELARAVWGYDTMGNRNFVEAAVSRLRRKLVAAGAPWRTVSTVRGFGYTVGMQRAS